MRSEIDLQNQNLKGMKVKKLQNKVKLIVIDNFQDLEALNHLLVNSKT